MATTRKSTWYGETLSISSFTPSTNLLHSNFSYHDGLPPNNFIFLTSEVCSLICPIFTSLSFFLPTLIIIPAAAKSLQLCPTLCDPIDGSPLGSPVPGILQARTLEWVAISFSNAWKWKGKVKSLSRVRLLATPWTAAHQASPSTGFSRQEY